MIWLLEDHALWRLSKDKQWVWCCSCTKFLPWSMIYAHLAWTRSKEYLSDKYADSKLKAVKAREV